MNQQFVTYLIVALCVLSVMVDFTSRIMSIASDGLIMGGVLYLLFRLRKMQNK